MCDTLGKLVAGGPALFAKNSDRSPNEPQVLEYRPARDYPDGAQVSATYMAVPQAPHTHATLLSRPVWMWGAEMGVNEHGVCMGNEAVFTKGAYGKTGLTGMDLLRLGLERGATAKEALEVIIGLLERYGQGGDCGYDHSFFYDNAFLILDRRELYLLETAGRAWTYKRVEAGSISNRLSIGAEGDASSGAPCDFKKRHLESVYSHFSGSSHRLAQTAGCLAGVNAAPDMMAALRKHRREDAPLCRNDVASPCMHAGGLVGDHSTASLVVELGEEITLWATGSSTPCISLFKPWRFGGDCVPPVFPAGSVEAAAAYWRQREEFHRRAVGHILPAAFYGERDELERSWYQAAAGGESFTALSRRAAEEERAFYEKWRAADLGPRRGKAAYLRYWEKKTAALREPERPVVDGE